MKETGHKQNNSDSYMTSGSLPPTPTKNYTLTSFFPESGRAQDNGNLLVRPAASGQVTMNYDNALLYAMSRVKHMPKGTRFPFVGLWKVNGREINIINNQGGIENRHRGSIARVLKQMKLICEAGLTTEGQEKRNNGLATKWVVI